MSFLTRKSQMSVQRRKQSLQKPNHLHLQTNSGSAGLQNPNVVQSTYVLRLSQHDTASSDPAVTCLFNITKDPTWKRVYLDIRSFSTVVLGVIDGMLPGGLALRSSQLSGAKGADQLPTKTLAIAKPKSVSLGHVAADITAYSAVYQMVNQQCLWDITDVNSLSLYLAVVGSDTAIVPPYANQAIVQVAIIGVK